MTLKPRKTRRRSQAQIAWARIKTTRGWGLSSPNPLQNHKQLFLIVLIGLFVFSLVGTVAVPAFIQNPAYTQFQHDHPASDRIVGPNGTMTDPIKPLWYDAGSSWTSNNIIINDTQSTGIVGQMTMNFTSCFNGVATTNCAFAVAFQAPTVTSWVQNIQGLFQVGNSPASPTGILSAYIMPSAQGTSFGTKTPEGPILARADKSVTAGQLGTCGGAPITQTFDFIAASDSVKLAANQWYTLVYTMSSNSTVLSGSSYWSPCGTVANDGTGVAFACGVLQDSTMQTNCFDPTGWKSGVQKAYFKMTLATLNVAGWNANNYADTVTSPGVTDALTSIRSVSIGNAVSGQVGVNPADIFAPSNSYVAIPFLTYEPNDWVVVFATSQTTANNYNPVLSMVSTGWTTRYLQAQSCGMFLSPISHGSIAEWYTQVPTAGQININMTTGVPGNAPSFQAQIFALSPGFTPDTLTTPNQTCKANGTPNTSANGNVTIGSTIGGIQFGYAANSNTACTGYQPPGTGFHQILADTGADTTEFKLISGGAAGRTVQTLWGTCANPGWITISDFWTGTPTAPTGVTGIISASTNSHGAHGSIDLRPTSTFNAVVISQSGVDYSVVATKVLEITQDLILNSTSNCCSGNINYFLTRSNSTANIGSLYDPTADSNVAVDFQLQPVSPNTGKYTGVVYLQRDPSKSISSQNVGCNTGTGTSFMCGASYTFTLDTVGREHSDIYLNYTATTNAQSQSDMVYISFPVGGIGNAGNVTTHPWFNFQSQPYFYGISLSGQTPMDFQASSNPPLSSVFQNTNTMVTGIFIPNPTATAPAAFVDTGGFFGLVGRTLTGAWNIVTGAVGGAINSIVNNPFTQSIYTDLLNALTGFLSMMIQGIQTFLNGVGSLFGWGKLGDSFISIMNGLVSTVANTLAAIPSYVGDIVNRTLNFLSIVSTLAGQIIGSNGLLSGLFTVASTIVTQAVIIFAKLTLFGATGITVGVWLLYFDMVGSSGVEGFGAWFALMKWLTFGFLNVLILIINKALTAITDILSYVPTIAAHMPENGLPAIPNLQNAGFPGFSGMGQMEKLRSGDIGSLTLFLFGGGIFASILGLNIPGNPVSSLSAASGCKPTTCFANSFNQVFLPFTAMFVLIIMATYVSGMLFGMSQGEAGPAPTVTIRSGGKGPKPPKDAKLGRVQRGIQSRARQARTSRFVTAQRASKQSENIN